MKQYFFKYFPKYNTMKFLTQSQNIFKKKMSLLNWKLALINVLITKSYNRHFRRYRTFNWDRNYQQQQMKVLLQICILIFINIKNNGVMLNFLKCIKSNAKFLYRRYIIIIQCVGPDDKVVLLRPVILVKTQIKFK